jgi:hypothetical protein
MVFSLESCDDFLNVAPSDEYSDSSVFVDVDGAQQVLTGAYNWFTNGWYSHYTNQYILFMPDVMGDDAMVNSTGNYNRFVAAYQYSIPSNSTYSVDPWIGCYSLIDNCNAILDHIESLPESNQRNRIEGEALALRVYAYHWLVRMYAKPVKLNPQSPGIILRLTSGTEDMPRSTVAECYTVLTQDIEKACSLLNGNSSSSKCYITDKAAHAIAARVYLDLGDQTNGISHANQALSGLTLMSTSQYKANMCENNSETIWYFTCTSTDKQNYLSLPAFWYYCDDEQTYIADGYSSLGVAKEFIDIFDDSDIRKTLFVKVNGEYYKRNGSYMTSKICHRKAGDSDGTPGSGSVAFAEGDFNMLRGSEMYLIIAELAADNNMPEALTALNEVRKARGLSDFSGSGDALKTEIQNERRRELFTEGHRFFDIKRRNLALNRSSLSLDWSAVGTLPAGSDKFELPIPQDEIDANGALTAADQNPAYK